MIFEDTKGLFCYKHVVETVFAIAREAFCVFDDSTTQCLLFPEIFRKPVVAQFDQRQGSSDGGALLLKAADRHYGLVAGTSSCLRDDRQAGKVDHCCASWCRSACSRLPAAIRTPTTRPVCPGPIHKMLLERDPIQGRELASQPRCRVSRTVGVTGAVSVGRGPGRQRIRRHAKRLHVAPTASPSILIRPTIPPTGHSSYRFSTGTTTAGATSRSWDLSASTRKLNSISVPRCYVPAT